MFDQNQFVRVPIIALVMIVFVSGFSLGQATLADSQQTTEQALASLRNVGKEAAGFDEAMPAADRLRRIPVGELDLLLDGMSGANPIAENWVRGVVIDVVRNAGGAPLQLLTEYAMDQSRNPTGRGLAMELIRRQSPENAEALIAQCMDDAALPLREMAVQQAIDDAQKMVGKDSESAKEKYREALAAARHPVQLESIVDALREQGEENVSIAESFAMITGWKSLAPFNNVDGVGYETVFPPEDEFTSTGSIDLDTEHEGKSGPVGWMDVKADEESGTVDLAEAYDKEKGAVSYLYTLFDSSTACPAIARLGCINANKVWINGKLVMDNEVYHSGSMIDQYTADIELATGPNHILLKICQNEQTESWAQDWEFQFRITDPAGKALRSGD